MNNLLQTRISQYYSSTTYEFIRFFWVLLVMVFPLTQSYGQCDPDCSGTNSFFGKNAGLSNTIGQRNSFFGEDAGALNTTGSFNSFFGQNTGSTNTTGERNSFFGNNTGSTNTTGERNSFLYNSCYWVSVS